MTKKIVAKKSKESVGKKLTTIEKIKKQRDELRSKIAKSGKTALQTIFKELFKECPQVEAIRWTQYTPHFNDGEACEFSRYSLTYKIAGITFVTYRELSSDYDDHVFYSDDGFIDSFDLEHGKKSSAYKEAHALAVANVKNFPALVKKLDEFERSLIGTDDMFEVAFGDHCRVTADRKGFTVEEYEHD